jgi:hypothetical protein
MEGAAVTSIKLPYIKRYRDRHGHERHYVRRRGHPTVALPGLPGSPEFMSAYLAAIAGKGSARPSRFGSATLGQLVTEYYRSVEFANLKASSQAVYRVVLGGLVEKLGHRLVREMPRD